LRSFIYKERQHYQTASVGWPGRQRPA